MKSSYSKNPDNLEVFIRLINKSFIFGKKSNEIHDKLYTELDSNFGDLSNPNITRVLEIINKLNLSDDCFNRMIEKYKVYLGFTHFTQPLLDLRLDIKVIDHIIDKLPYFHKSIIANPNLDLVFTPNDILHIGNLLTSQHEGICENRMIKIINGMSHYGFSKHYILNFIATEKYQFNLIWHCVYSSNESPFILMSSSFICPEKLAKRCINFTPIEKLKLAEFIPELRMPFNINELDLSIWILSEDHF